MSASKIHQQLLSVLSELTHVEKQAVLLFAEILERRLFRELGYSSMRQYAREALGFSDSHFFQFQRLAKSLKILPKVKDAVTEGEITWTDARTLARVAKPESQREWIDLAKKTTSRELERQVKSARASEGDLPVPDLFEKKPTPPACVEQTVSLKLTPEQLAQFESLMEALRKQGLKGSREEVLLAALDDCTRERWTRVQSSPKQIVLYQCEDCGQTRVQTSRGALSLSAGVAEQAVCDAQILGKDGMNRSTIPPARRKRVLARDHYQCTSPGCGNTRFLEVHHIKPRARGGINQEENLTTLCSACHRLLHERAALPGKRSGSPSSRLA
jgi:hypothetical protein